MEAERAGASAAPRLAAIVPSYQRRDMLERVLEALRRQTAPAGSFEVIVVLDGSTDGSAELLDAWQRERRLPGLRWERQANAGQSAARDRGARLATAPVLLFLDDDVLAAPELVARHLEWHASGERIAVLGDCEITPDGRPPEVPSSLYLQYVRSWWEDMYRVRALPGRQPNYRDFCAGNVSLRRDDYLAVGGFDAAFRGYGGEDYELGYRLLRAGVRFIADRGARAEHHHRQTVRAAIRTSRQEGGSDVLLGRLHPELRGTLRLMRVPPDATGRRLARLAFRAPAAGAVIERVGGVLLDVAEWLRLRGAWFALTQHLRAFAYWRGVREALGSEQALDAYRREAPVLEQTLEVSDGVPPLAALGAFWVHGPSRVRLTWRGAPLGVYPIDRAIDGPLRPYLADWLLWRLPGAAWLAAAQGEPGPFGDQPGSVAT